MTTYYRHKYGGIYSFITECINTDDKSKMVVYKHVYPFEEKTYVRNSEEFYKNFSELTELQFKNELLKPREDLQKEINNACPKK